MPAQRHRYPDAVLPVLVLACVGFVGAVLTGRRLRDAASTVGPRAAVRRATPAAGE